jgi:hypothetical protein
MPKINWNEIEVSNAIILKENEIIRVKFLDNGTMDDYEIFDNTTEKIKVITKYSFSVIDLSNNQERELSIIQSRLMNLLKEYQPLKDKSLNINKFRTGMEIFDIDFKVSLIE